MFEIGTFEDLVVDVGKILDVFDSVATPLQIAADGIPHNIRPGVTEMAVIVYSHPTTVHFHLVRCQGLERLFGSGEGVVYG